MDLTRFVYGKFHGYQKVILMLPKQMFNMWWLTMVLLLGSWQIVFGITHFFLTLLVSSFPDEHHHLHGSQFSRREGSTEFVVCLDVPGSQ